MILLLPNRRLILVLFGFCSAVLLIPIFVIQPPDQGEHKLIQVSSRHSDGERSTSIQELRDRSIGGISSDGGNAFISVVQEKSLAGKSLSVDAGPVVLEESAQVLVPPPFLYEINRTKFALLDIDQQLSVQKAFESYLALHQGGKGVPDINSLNEESERIKDQLESEIGPLTVHDLIQGE